MALSAVGLIFENLRTAYTDGKNLEAREKMSLASTYAGFAFTRANVGYVHAIAHQFGGLYHTPHGWPTPSCLPFVLKYSHPAIVDRLALLAVAARVGSRDEARTCAGAEVPGCGGSAEPGSGYTHLLAH
jgi:alcohol dehydrogenase